MTLFWTECCEAAYAAGKQPYMSTQFGDLYRKWSRVSKATMRISRKPGETFEVDWAGTTVDIHDSVTGEITPAYLFVGVLSYSSLVYAELCRDMKSENFILCHVYAYEYFGGLTRMVVPDNCKVAVARNKDWITPVLNKDFQAWAEHNNTVLTPAKVKFPRWKPVVEGHVKIITMHILMDMEDMVFYSLDDLNRVLIEKVAAENWKPFEGLTYSRYDLFTRREGAPPALFFASPILLDNQQ